MRPCRPAERRTRTGAVRPCRLGGRRRTRTGWMRPCRLGVRRRTRIRKGSRAPSRSGGTHAGLDGAVVGRLIGEEAAVAIRATAATRATLVARRIAREQASRFARRVLLARADRRSPAGHWRRGGRSAQLIQHPHARALGMPHSLTICNVATSAMVRECRFAYITRAGVEVGVASTKAFTTQLVGLFLLTLALAQVRGRLTEAQEQQHLKAQKTDCKLHYRLLLFL